MQNLDFDFLRRAEQVASFNLQTRDFESLKNKREIQHLFNKHFFPKFDVSLCLDRIEKNSLNSLITKLKTQDVNKFMNLFKYNLRGIGPGEVMLYFLVNTAVLGGGSSAGLDLIVNGQGGFEVKSVNIGKGGHAYDFNMGGTVPLTELTSRLLMLARKHSGAVSGTEVSVSKIEELRRTEPGVMQSLETDFAKIAYDHYFSKHDIIFVHNSGANVGLVEAVKRVQIADIKIERLSKGTIKPMVKI